MQLWGQFKTQARARMWPQGEASNLVAAHDKMFVDAIVDLQQWVECLQQDNTQIVEYCETFFNCGITAIDAPRGNIKRLSVVDKINQETVKEDPTLPTDYCSEIVYLQIDPCYIHKFISTTRNLGCCPDIGGFFAVPTCGKRRFPPPTDTGLTGLAPLPLGFHYAQKDASTDAKYRARRGIWAMERGKIYVAPWIQSTETIILKWDGIKRTWNDNDQMDDDPLLAQAIENYVLAEHADKFDRDYAAGESARAKFNDNRAVLMRQCDEETRVRNCEASKARSSIGSLTSLYYNDTEQSFTAQCPDGTSGQPVTVSIPVGLVSSNVSVADANQLAYQQAQTQAQATLNCTDTSSTFTNDAQTYTATCGTETGAPTPIGSNKTVTIPAGSVVSNVSKAEANSIALAQATAEATAQLNCTWFNAPQTFVALCDSNHANDQTVSIPSGQYSSTTSQADADQQALAAATTQANTQLASACSGLSEYWNTEQVVNTNRSCPYVTIEMDSPGHIHSVVHPCAVNVTVTIAAHTFNSTVSQLDANNIARSYASALGNNAAISKCTSRQCGNYTMSYP